MATDVADRVRAVTVIGAGIQGSCTALELARRGYAVTLLDRDTLAMNRASLRNEGKIHLGLVYAADTTMATARLQLEGALSFWPLLRRWIDCDVAALALSTCFHYLVARDSLLAPEQLAHHYQRLQAYYRQALAEHGDLDYLGSRPEQLFRQLDATELKRHYREHAVASGFATAERSISTERLAILVRSAIRDSSAIEFLGAHEVTHVSRCGDRFLIEGVSKDRSFALLSDQVVNAAWDGRLALDEQMGLHHFGWVHRLKYRVIVRLPRCAAAPSATMVLGRYGDVVMRPDDTAYLSWYPTAMRGWSHDLRPPESWQGPCSGIVGHQDFETIYRETLSAISQWYPALTGAVPECVDAGIIVAHGTTDVDDPASGLHARTRVGVTSLGGYHSLDAGKLTTAPMFAVQAAQQVDAHT
jgi:glycine/D-amino acid oxidase-like deaminating enzyme